MSLNQRVRPCLFALLCAALASILLSSAAHVAKAQQPLAKDIENKVVPLVADLKKFTATVPEDVRTQLRSLKAALDELEKKTPLAELVDRIDEMKKLVDTIDVSKPTVKATIWPSLVDQTGTLIEALAKIEIIDPTAAARRRADLLKAAAMDGETIATYPPLRNAINGVLPAIEKIEAVRSEEAKLRRTIALTQLLTGKVADPAPKTVPAAIEELAAALSTLRQQAEAEPQYLNIVQAWFGDLHYVRRAASGQLRINPNTGTGFRVCDATNELRSACQGKTSCPFSLEGGTPTVLCGEHPAPDGSLDVVGVGVEFQCLSAAQADWNGLQNEWKIAGGVPSKMVMLRAGTPVTIRCAAVLSDFEAKEEAGVGGGGGSAAPKTGQIK